MMAGCRRQRVIAKTGGERPQDSKAKKGGRARHPIPLLEEIKSQHEEQGRNKKGPDKVGALNRAA
jgi:hypothetical protein